MNILFKNARILTMKDKNLLHGDLLVKGNRIAFIGDSGSLKENYDQIIECDGNLLMPGFKNAHTHSAMTFLRSKSDDLSLQSWLFDEVFPHEDRLIPSDINPLAKLAFLEYLTSGITACLDQYFYPEEFIKAANEFGMRTLTIPVHDELSRPMDEIIHLYKKYNADENALSKVGICIHADYTATKNTLEKSKEILKTLGGVPFYTHLGETKKEFDDAIRNYGMSQFEYLDSFGLFDNGGAIFHGVYLTDHDLELIKKHNVTIVTNPGSNCKLASGIAEIEKYHKLGINVAIGTDGPASNNCLDFFKEMTLVANLQKIINKDPSSMPAFEVLKMATVNGAKAFGLDDADVLDVNKLADIIMIDLHQPNMQPFNNIVNNIVYSGSKSNIKMTMINGKILYMNHEFLIDEDIEEIYKKVQLIADDIIAKTKAGLSR